MSGPSDGSELSWEQYQTLINSIVFSVDEPETKEYILNALEHGASGNGTADDTQPIQKCINTLRDLHGGTLYFPPGTYKITSSLILYSNITIKLDNGATLLRGSENIKFMMLTNCPSGTLEYNGESNITIEGGTIDIGTGITQGSCAAGLFHASNIKIRNTTIRHNNAGYHMLDICGCKNVTVENCILKDSLSTVSSAELIQFDGAGGWNQFPSPQVEAGDATFDGTPTVNVEVKGCRFELNSYSPAFGNHNAQVNKNIDIHDNVIVGTSGDRGAVAFNHNTALNNVTTQVLIHHNIFEGCTIGFNFRADADAPGRIYVRDNIFKGIGTLKKNPDSPVGEFLNNIELT